MSIITTRRNLRSDRGSVDGELVMLWSLGAFIALVVAGIVAVIVFALVAAANTPSAGEIKAKHFEPAHSTTFCHLVGKVTVCSPQYYPDSWQFDLANVKEHKEGWVDVSESTYTSHRVGDWYDTES